MFPDNVFTEKTESEFLPLHNVMNIARSVVPEGTRFTESAKEYLQTVLSEFLHVFAAKLVLGGKTAVNDEDCLQVIESLGLVQYSTILKVFMSDYREMSYNIMLHRLQEIGAGESILVLTGGAAPTTVNVPSSGSSSPPTKRQKSRPPDAFLGC